MQVLYMLNLSDIISKTSNVVMLVTAGSQYHAHIIYIYIYDLYQYSMLHAQLHCFSNYHQQTTEKISRTTTIFLFYILQNETLQKA